MLRRTSRAVVALAGFTAASLGASRAALAEPTVIAGPATLGGLRMYDELVVESGMISVKPYDATVPDSGKVIIKANKITVKATATLSATGAGYPGVDLGMGDAGAGMNGNGLAETNSNGGGRLASMVGLPGGGGGYYGKGASGLDDKCALFPSPDDTTGGLGFFNKTTMMLTLGSAGGAANVSSVATRGGNGGGMIVLEAAEIIIDGVLEAKGESRNALAGVGPGGGSGGTLQIVTSKLSGAGTLSVKGGDGGQGSGGGAIKANNGGGGGGGVIMFVGATPPASFTNITLGGTTGACGSMNDAEPGIVLTTLPGKCVDVDNDMHPSKLCGGDDCDDLNPAIHPGVAEKCDGIDNDCSETVDDNSPCDVGMFCESSDAGSACKPIPDAGADAGFAPDHVEFRGGCEVTPPGAASDLPWWIGGAVPSLGALGLAIRGLAARRRRRQGGRR